MKQHQAPDPRCANWWQDGALLRRFVSDFMHAELIMMRRGSAGLPSLPWPEGLQLEADLGIDSLERYTLATALSACLHLHESGADQALLGCTTLEQWIACASNGLDQYSAALRFTSSGSSGVPKSCPPQPRHAMARGVLFRSTTGACAARLIYRSCASHLRLPVQRATPAGMRPGARLAGRCEKYASNGVDRAGHGRGRDHRLPGTLVRRCPTHPHLA